MLRLPVRSANGLLDGLLRGRAWVACVGLLLSGIVFLNVSLLGLNSKIAVTNEQAAELRRENAELRLEVAKLGSSERIQRVAEARGFVMPAPGDVTYLEADRQADGRRAARALGAVASRPDADPEASEAVTDATDAVPAETAPAATATPAPTAPTAEAPLEPAG